MCRIHRQRRLPSRGRRVARPRDAECPESARSQVASVTMSGGRRGPAAGRPIGCRPAVKQRRGPHGRACHRRRGGGDGRRTRDPSARSGGDSSAGRDGSCRLRSGRGRSAACRAVGSGPRSAPSQPDQLPASSASPTSSQVADAAESRSSSDAGDAGPAQQPDRYVRRAAVHQHRRVAHRRAQPLDQPAVRPAHLGPVDRAVPAEARWPSGTPPPSTAGSSGSSSCTSQSTSGSRRRSSPEQLRRSPRPATGPARGERRSRPAPGRRAAAPCSRPASTGRRPTASPDRRSPAPAPRAGPGPSAQGRPRLAVVAAGRVAQPPAGRLQVDRQLVQQRRRPADQLRARGPRAGQLRQIGQVRALARKRS